MNSLDFLTSQQQNVYGSGTKSNFRSNKNTSKENDFLSFNLIFRAIVSLSIRNYHEEDFPCRGPCNFGKESLTYEFPN